MKTNEKNAELISVLMPVYNVEPYVSEAIESILHQTYSNFEFIIVDDCSTDGTYALCQKYAVQDKRIRLFQNAENKKIAATLNFGLSKAMGKYIVRMDGDDVSVPDRLERMKNYLEEHTDISLVGTSIINIDENGAELGEVLVSGDKDLIQKTCHLRSPVFHIWMTYKDVYDKLGGYRLVAPSEDYDFILRFITSGYKCTNMSDFFAQKIRIGRSGNSTSLFGLKKLKSSEFTVKNYRKRIKTGSDDFSVDSYERYLKTSALSEKIFALSTHFLYKAVVARSHKNLFLMIFYALFSCVSPWQMKYLYRNALYRLVARGCA